jgi:hypothetical protein
MNHELIKMKGYYTKERDRLRIDNRLLEQNPGMGTFYETIPADDCVLARSDALGTFKGNVTYSLKICKQ